MELKYLYTVKKIVETGSYQKAAAALNYAQSTITFQIGTLTVALPETLVTYQMQPILKAFKEKAPHVRLSLQVINCYAVYERMLGGNIDIAIHYEAGKYPPSIVTKKIETYPLVLVSSTALDEDDRDFISPDQKKPVCHIQNDPNALYLKIFNQYLRKKNIILET